MVIGGIAKHGLSISKFYQCEIFSVSVKAKSGLCLVSGQWINIRCAESDVIVFTC